MAVDVVEGDENVDDEDENELREVWARFESQVSKDPPTSSRCADHNDHSAKHTSGRPKRKCREDARDDMHLESSQRRKLGTSSSMSSLPTCPTSQNTTSKSCTLPVLGNDPPAGRRSGLRSAKIDRNG